MTCGCATIAVASSRCCNGSFGFWDVRGKASISPPQQQHQRFRVGASHAARRPLQPCCKTLYTSSPSSSHLAGAGAVQRRRSSRLGLSLGSRSHPANDSRGRPQRIRPKAKDDDFEIDEDGGFDVTDLADLDEDEEEDFRDYETEYEASIGYRPLQESDSFVNTEGEAEETVVAWRINEEEFHKISLLTCDFFIRKVADDADDDVYDFREMYVTPPDTDVYSIPKVEGLLPKKPVRCTLSNYEYIHTTEPPIDGKRSPLAKNEYEVMKVFLMKHLKDRRAGHESFILDFEEIYVIDDKTKSFSKADVKVEVSGSKDRDRSEEVLIIRDNGTSFRIIPEAEEKSPDEIIHALHWEKTREAMENYLRGFRDYETSNWF